jgi:O-antigen/teichoic acid export membrane protein
MLRFGAPLIFANSGLFVLHFSDRFFLQHLRSLEAVGIYALGYKFGYMLNFLVVQPFFVMWQARMYHIHAHPDHRDIFKRIFALYSVGLIYAGLAMSLFSSEMITVMAEAKYAASQDVIPVVVLSYVFYGISYYGQLGMLLTDHTRTIGIIGAVLAAVNLGLNYVLVLKFGMMGAAFATALSFALLAGISYWQSLRVFDLRLGMSRMAVPMALAITLYVACRLWLSSSFGVAVPVKLAVLAVFPLIVWKSGMLPAGAAAILVSAKDRVTARFGRRFATLSPKVPH